LVKQEINEMMKKRPGKQEGTQRER
jgi:hypothetical protein